MLFVLSNTALIFILLNKCAVNNPFLRAIFSVLSLWIFSVFLRTPHQMVHTKKASLGLVGTGTRIEPVTY